jgi:hypothetical protein
VLLLFLVLFLPTTGVPGLTHALPKPVHPFPVNIVFLARDIELVAAGLGVALDRAVVGLVVPVEVTRAGVFAELVGAVMSTSLSAFLWALLGE